MISIAVMGNATLVPIMPQRRHCSPTLLFLPDSGDITHRVSFSLAVVAAAAASWDYWQPTVNYSSLQVAVTYGRAWPLSGQHGIKSAQVRWPLTAA